MIRLISELISEVCLKKRVTYVSNENSLAFDWLEFVLAFVLVLARCEVWLEGFRIDGLCVSCMELTGAFPDMELWV